MPDLPCLSHDQAEAVGQELARWLEERTQLLDPLDELQWADAVQLVLRRAGEAQREREEMNETARSAASASARPSQCEEPSEPDGSRPALEGPINSEEDC